MVDLGRVDNKSCWRVGRWAAVAQVGKKVTGGQGSWLRGNNLFFLHSKPVDSLQAAHVSPAGLKKGPQLFEDKKSLI